MGTDSSVRQGLCYFDGPVGGIRNIKDLETFMPKLETVSDFRGWRSYKVRPKNNSLVLAVDSIGHLPHTLIMRDNGLCYFDQSQGFWGDIVEKILRPRDYRWIYFSEIMVNGKEHENERETVESPKTGALSGEPLLQGSSDETRIEDFVRLKEREEQP